MKLHEKFRQLRKEKNWSQEYVANQIFVSKKTISSWETGHRQMDADAIESLSKLYGYELLPEEKKEITGGFFSIHDIMKNPTMSLSAKDIIGQNKVTLRVDIAQKVKKSIRHLSEAKNLSLDDIVEEALLHYIEHLNQQDALPKEDGYYHIQSDYYEQEMAFDRKEAETLLEIYQDVASKQGFTPDATTVQEIVEEVGKLDTVLYHVEEFGQEHEKFSLIEHLFEEEEGIKVFQKVNGWTIKEKPLDQVPSFIEDDRRFSVYSPDGRCMEDNLTKEEAIEWANENNDYA